jgi:hypothetical protein
MMIRREMQPIRVEAGGDGNVTITQAIFHMNEPDPSIELTCEQTPMVAAWLLEAAGEASQSLRHDDDRPIPVRYFARGPEAEAELLEVYCNEQGMVILKIDDSAFLELAPAMAKRLREQLSVAIRGSLTELLRPDSEV